MLAYHGAHVLGPKRRPTRPPEKASLGFLNVQAARSARLRGVMLHRDEWRDVLSLREFEVALLVAEGASNKQVARQLGLSEGTVKLHVSNILRKVAARSRSDLIKLGASPNVAAQNASRQSRQAKTPQKRRP